MARSTMHRIPLWCYSPSATHPHSFPTVTTTHTRNENHRHSTSQPTTTTHTHYPTAHPAPPSAATVAAHPAASHGVTRRTGAGPAPSAAGAPAATHDSKGARLSRRVTIKLPVRTGAGAAAPSGGGPAVRALRALRCAALGHCRRVAVACMQCQCTAVTASRGIAVAASRGIAASGAQRLAPCSCCARFGAPCYSPVLSEVLETTTG